MQPIRVLVLDMQPISPPIGGGRIRLLGLYHGLGADLQTTYVGTYDWPDDRHREEQLTPTLREVLIPLSEEHFAAHEELKRQVGGRIVIDTAFHMQVHHSPKFCERVLAELARADVVICSHPWVYPLIENRIDLDRQLLVYDAHNVEGFLRLGLLDDGAVGSEIAEEVVRVEMALCRRSHLVLCCSHQDLMMFHETYGIAAGRLRVVPNGVFTGRVTPASSVEKRELRQKLRIIHPTVAIFLGSDYAPNAEAARFLAETVAPQRPSTLFVIAGGVGASLTDERPPCFSGSNVFVTGYLTEEEKLDWLRVSDVATNPMFSGSGTNIKMFDFLAAGLPVIATEIGARGIDWREEGCIQVCRPEDCAAAVTYLLSFPALLSDLAAGARRLAEQKFSFESISRKLGCLLHKKFASLGKPSPHMTFILPQGLGRVAASKALDSLSRRSGGGFEVIRVRSDGEPAPRGQFPFHYSEVAAPGEHAALLFEGALALAEGESVAFLTAADCDALDCAAVDCAIATFPADGLRLCPRPFPDHENPGRDVHLEQREIRLASFLGRPADSLRSRLAKRYGNAGSPSDALEDAYSWLPRFLSSTANQEEKWTVDPLIPATFHEDLWFVILEDLLDLPDEEFLSSAFSKLLRRLPNPGETNPYRSMLQAGEAKSDVIFEMARSAPNVRVLSLKDLQPLRKRFATLYQANDAKASVGGAV